jgi:glyoxylase-like metal-dependent hydrolase (beta-lactamase superfamily II)
VIDASVEPAVYVGLAEGRRWRIRHVLDTHVHADHLSRSQRLVEIVGAKLYMPEGAPIFYPQAALADGDVVEIGSSRLTAIRTPGHTAESTSYLLEDGAIFTGDTLFLSAVGRPDLEATLEGAREKAHVLFGSVDRLLDLPSQALVLPGHTSEPVPFDGEPISAPLSEVREEVGPLLEDEDRFVQKVAGGISPTPENYERIIALNRSGEQPDGDPTELEAGANRCAAG